MKIKQHKDSSHLCSNILKSASNLNAQNPSEETFLQEEQLEGYNNLTEDSAGLAETWLLGQRVKILFLFHQQKLRVKSRGKVLQSLSVAIHHHNVRMGPL